MEDRASVSEIDDADTDAVFAEAISQNQNRIVAACLCVYDGRVCVCVCVCVYDENRSARLNVVRSCCWFSLSSSSSSSSRCEDGKCRLENFSFFGSDPSGGGDEEE